MLARCALTVFVEMFKVLQISLFVSPLRKRANISFWRDVNSDWHLCSNIPENLIKHVPFIWRMFLFFLCFLWKKWRFCVFLADLCPFGLEKRGMIWCNPWNGAFLRCIIGVYHIMIRIVFTYDSCLHWRFFVRKMAFFDVFVWKLLLTKCFLFYVQYLQNLCL